MRPRGPAWLLALCLAGSSGAQERVVLEPVTEVFSPTFAGHAGDERLFIADRPGQIFIWSEAGGLRTTPFLDIRNLVLMAGEGGLLSFAFHPDYARNGLFFVSYTAGSPFRSVITRFQVSADPNVADPLSRRVMLELVQPDSTHNGGQIQFGPDGHLYISFGDGGFHNDPECRAQRDDDFFGTLLRIDVDQDPDTAPFYGIPADNPFAGDDGIADEIWATGLRNPWRFSFDRQTGDLFIADVGEATREEVDHQPAGSPGGQDYGWRVMEGTACHDPDARADPDCPADVPPCFDPGLTPPILDYGHSLGDRSVIGGYVYRGQALPSLSGLYVFGDFGSGRIWTLRRGDDGIWTRAQIFQVFPQLTSFGEDAAGELYALSLGGRVFRFEAGGPVETVTDPACIRTLNLGFERIAEAGAAGLRRCAKEGARDQLPVSIDACVRNDRSGKLGEASARALEEAEGRCQGTPAFGPADPDDVAAAARGLAPSWARDAFGQSLEEGLLQRSSEKPLSACQERALRALARCQRARIREFNRCKRRGLEGGEIAGAAALSACMAADPKGRIARLCDPRQGRLATRAVDKGCAGRGLDLQAAFPGCGAAGADAVSDCLDRVQRCRVCLALSAADELGADCERFDDGLANASCP